MSDYFSDGVSRRAFARDIGVDEKTVRNLISKDILTTDSNQQISLSQGRKAYMTYRKKTGAGFLQNRKNLQKDRCGLKQ